MFVYISEAHAIDVWNIGLSAGVLNTKHQTISDRSMCATKMIETHDFTIETYLDNMNNDLQNQFSAWPVRYYLIESNNDDSVYKFNYIPTPTDSEFDFDILIQKILN